MNSPVTRTVSLIEPHADKRLGREGLSLSDFRSDHSYVLLGEPGLGKSTEFETEARHVQAPDPIPARRFINRDPERHPEWQAGPLFIDGLDEVRASSADPRSPLDRIVARLEALGNPPFRLSCRSGSWLERGDRRELSSLPGAASLRILELNRLSRNNVRCLVSNRRDDADEFMFEALEHGLDAFLWNPQLLAVLLDAVEADGWPDSPRAAFENACRELSTERNPEHQDARRAVGQPGRDAVLRAAGLLSALLLLTGKEGWTTTDTDDPDLLSLRDVEDGGGRDELLAALESGLFAGSATCRTPVHRLVAEFLAARYLDGRIRAPRGTTLRRVLSLLLGHDGIPVPDLRGLSAWLASLNADARTLLIPADPVAVAFGGDTTDFTPGERQELLAQLENSPSLPIVWPSSIALGALAGSPDRSPLWELTSSPVRTDARQNLVARLLAGYRHKLHSSTAGPGRTSATDYDLERRALLRIVRDDSWRGHVRCKALDALDRLLTGPDRSSALRGILSDIESDRLPDQDLELLGTLLGLLYPQALRPTEIWEHLATRPRVPGATSYSMFWSTLVDESDPEQIRLLLDSLCDRAQEVLPRLADDGLGSIVLELLARGLELFGESMTVAELHRWFALVNAAPNRTGLVPAHCHNVLAVDFFPELSERIHTWLSTHQAVQYKLIERGLGEREDDVGRRALDQSIGRKFVGDEAQPRFRQWCLGRAIELAGRRPRIAEELAWWAIRSRSGWGPPMSDEEVARAVRINPTLREWNTRRMIAKADWEREEAEREERDSTVASLVRERRREYVTAVREHAVELAEGRCRPALLNELAQVYFDGLDDAGASTDPLAPLRQRLDGDDALLRAALTGFRKLLSRHDLHDLPEAARTYGDGRFSFFALPFLAGLAEEERAGHDPLLLLDEAGLRRALGYYLTWGQHVSLFSRRTVGDSSDDRDGPGGPRWYRSALESNPEAVADAIIAVHRAQVRKKAGPDRQIRDLSRDPAYAEVAPLAVPRMFGVFPSRCTEPQVETLRLVLWAALDPRNMPPAEFADVVRKRLRRRSMDVAQRIQWLCAGLFVAREEILPELVDYATDGRDPRIHHVVDFFVSPSNRFRGSLPLDKWKAEELAHLLRTIGRRTRRFDPPGGVGFLSDKQVARLRAEPLLSRLIGTLAARGDDEAAAALESLAEDPTLDGWRWELAQARETQAERLRAAKHRMPALASIQETLRGGRPASAADLAALVLDTLEELARRIRDDSTNDWRQYWHRDPETRRLVKPQHENDCRDALLSDLALRLQPHGADVQSEAQYADETRADIRIACGSRIAIPVEIKKNSHRDVWRAADEQLVAKYARAPESEGYGIYLVLWFGPDYTRVMPPCGLLPRTPAELRERLEAQLEPSQRAKVGVIVIDVSPSGRYTRIDPD
ncbi:MAG: hypothetical protein OXI39_04175 [Gemmatimonadota bacterium]|uniref:hypothetical protein n=1 Tax=Candidatus Palauibacter scopulicola TaxID=3056741 RepID=UPI00239755F3|nr:hypothetical protein [Candidatus Palauibacter scopulicola]MDE2662179.1 hypothetical protein [Candidatus Palauibacter scopulicola]